MMYFGSYLKSMSGEELIAIINGKIPPGLLSARTTANGLDLKIEAQIILNKRQNKGQIIIGVITTIIGTLSAAFLIYIIVSLYQWIKN